MDQHEITRETPLLNADGELTEPGYAKKLLPVYRRADIKASPMRIKEWDYYLINNGRFALALTIDDNGYMGLDSISLLNFEEGWEITTSPMCFMPLGKRKLPETSKTGDTTAIGKNYSIYFKNNGSGVRTLIAQMKRFGPAGSQHCEDAGMAYDAERDEYLRGLGLTVCRYSNLDVMRNFEGVCTDILIRLNNVFA